MLTPIRFKTYLKKHNYKLWLNIHIIHFILLLIYYFFYHNKYNTNLIIIQKKYAEISKSVENASTIVKN
jgi:hypothetical protein